MLIFRPDNAPRAVMPKATKVVDTEETLRDLAT